MVSLANTVFEPRKPFSSDGVLDELDSPLLPLYKFCESRNVMTLAGLEGAPAETLQLLKQHHLLPDIMRYLHGKRANEMLNGHS